VVAAFDERRLFIHEQLNTINGFQCARPPGSFYAVPNITSAVLHPE
jgi:aspartate/methionine/tyrosine aminotransferase